MTTDHLYNVQQPRVRKKKKKPPGGSTSPHCFDSSISSLSELERPKKKGMNGRSRSGNDSSTSIKIPLESSVSSVGHSSVDSQREKKKLPDKHNPMNVTNFASSSPRKDIPPENHAAKYTTSSLAANKSTATPTLTRLKNVASIESRKNSSTSTIVHKESSNPEFKKIKPDRRSPSNTAAKKRHDHVGQDRIIEERKTTKSPTLAKKRPKSMDTSDSIERNGKHKHVGNESQKHGSVHRYSISPKQLTKKSVINLQSPKKNLIQQPQPTTGKQASLNNSASQISEKRQLRNLSKSSGIDAYPESPRGMNRMIPTNRGGRDHGHSLLEQQKTFSTTSAAEVALRRPDSFVRGFSSGPQRTPPNRAMSSDLDYMIHQSPQSKASEVGRRSIRRCKSSDLELMAESSMQQRTEILAPPSILKNSSHHKCLRQNSSSSGGIGAPRRSIRARFLANTDSLSDDDDSIREFAIKFDDEPKQPRSSSPRPGLPDSRQRGHAEQGNRPGLKKARSGLVDQSGHSFMSTRSLMNIDRGEEFPDDPIWKKCLRYIRILPPHLHESFDKKRIRIYIWCTLFLDFIAAMVSITTYSGVTMCCGLPIFSLTFVNVNWTKAIRITTYIYLAMLLAEIIPVVRRGLPFNLLNPVVGFTITFAMFFDDRILEAVIMWIVGACAIFFEFLVFRLQRKLYHERYDRLDKVQQDLNPYISSRCLNPSKKRRDLSSSHSKRRLKLSSSTNTSNIGNANSSDEDSLSGHSFEDDENDIEGQLNSSAEFHRSTNHKLREARLLRERRLLRQRQAVDRTNLRYHLAGVVINFGLVCISLILIIVVASSGGLCIRSDLPIKVFDLNQLDRCSDCRGQIIDGKCEICSDMGDMQCYYQYI